MKISLKDGNKVEVIVIEENDRFNYYIGNNIIGIYNPNIMEDNILMLNNTLENELSSQIKDEINGLDSSDIIKESKENEKIIDYARELQIENIQQIRKIDLESKNIAKTKDNEKSNSEKDNTNPNITNLNQDDKTVTTNDINIKQEINLNERANDMQNIKQYIGGKLPDNTKKIGVIESTDRSKMVDEKGNEYANSTTRYSIVAISDKDDGKGEMKQNIVEPLEKYIPELKQRNTKGNNPTEQTYQVGEDDNVKEDAVLSEYQIGEKLIQLDNKECGEVQLNIGKEAHGSTEGMSVQVRGKNNAFGPNKEKLDVLGKNKGEYQTNNNLEEAKKHKEINPKCSKMKTKDIDGDKTTSSHDDISNDEVLLDKYSEKILENGKIDDVFSKDEVKAKLLKELKENNNKLSVGEILKKAEEDLEGDAEKFPTRQR